VPYERNRQRQASLAHPDSELLTKLRFLGAAEHVWYTQGGSPALARFCAEYGLIETVVREALLITRQLERLPWSSYADQSIDMETANDSGVPKDIQNLPTEPRWDDEEETDAALFASPEQAAAPSLSLGSATPLAPPSSAQEQELCRALVAAFPDQVARRMDTDEVHQWRQEYGQHGVGILFRCPSWDIHQTSATTTPVVAARVPPHCSVDPSRESARYVLYTELTMEDPEPPKVADKAPTRQVATLRGVTRIAPEWLASIGQLPLLQYGAVLAEPPPRYDSRTDQVMAWVRAFYGPEKWPLPIRWMPLPSRIEDHETGVILDQLERRRCLFARALLERQVLSEFPPQELVGILKPAPAVLTWALELEHPAGVQARAPTYRQHRAAVLWVAALGRYGIERRCSLLAQWRRDPQFLLYEFLLWVPASHQGMLQKNWVSIVARCCGSSNGRQQDV
jgi:hypothetical protein